MAVKAGTPPQVVLCDDNGIPITVSAGALSTTGGGGGGGGGAVTVADGADVAQGTTTDAESTSGSGTLVALVKNVRTRLTTLATLLNGGLPAALGTGGGVKVDGSGTALPVSGTVTSNAGTGTRLSDITKSTPTIVTGTGGALNDTPIASTEVFGRWVSVQLTSAGNTLTVAFEGSNDNTNWVAIALAGNLSSPASTTATITNNIIHGPVWTRYFRVRVSAYTSGTVTAVAVFSALPSSLHVMGADTELPAAAALADATSNPTSPAVGSFSHLYNGSTWDRVRGDITNGVDVDVTRNPVFTAPVTGELAGATSATQMPSVACKLVKFKAVAANAGKVYIGISGVTKIDGTTDTTSGFQLSPGEETGWIPIDNANRLYRICDNTGDALTYMAMN